MILLYEKYEYTKGVIRSRKSKKYTQYNGQTKNHKRRNIDLYQTTQKTESHWKPEVDSGVPEELAIPARHVTPVMLLLSDTNIIWYGNHMGHEYAEINTNNINKSWAPYKTNGSQDESNIAFYAETA